MLGLPLLLREPLLLLLPLLLPEAPLLAGKGTDTVALLLRLPEAQELLLPAPPAPPPAPPAAPPPPLLALLLPEAQALPESRLLLLEL
jgi:hypothetical protein